MPSSAWKKRLNSSHLVISYAVFCLKNNILCTAHRRDRAPGISQVGSLVACARYDGSLFFFFFLKTGPPPNFPPFPPPPPLPTPRFPPRRAGGKTARGGRPVFFSPPPGI